MSYEYMLGFGAEGEQSGSGKQRPVGQQQAGGQRRPGSRQQPSREQEKRLARTACGGAPCPEGLKTRASFRRGDNPVLLAEWQENMDGQGCILQCSVGNEYNYCCPSVSEARDVITDPFATAPVELAPAAALPAAAPSSGENGGSSGLVVFFGLLGLGVAGFIGIAALRRKKKRKKKSKGKK